MLKMSQQHAPLPEPGLLGLDDQVVHSANILIADSFPKH